MRHVAREPWFVTAVALAALLGAAGWRYDGFLGASLLVNLLDDGAMLGFAALGAMLVISSGGIDLSPGAVMALSSVVIAAAIGAGLPPLAAFALACACGTGLGALSGALIDVLALPPFIVTLAVMFLARGAALAIHVESLPIQAPAWQPWSRVELPVLGLDLAAVIWLLATGAVLFASRHARWMRHALALGGDQRTAAYFGVPVRRTRVAVYALGGLCSGAAGVAYTLYSSKGDSTAGVGMELDAIAAAVIGGTALRGGSASVAGAFLGVVLLGVLQTILVYEGVPGAGWTRVVLGALLLAFVVVRRALEARASR